MNSAFRWLMLYLDANITGVALFATVTSAVLFWERPRFVLVLIFLAGAFSIALSVRAMFLKFFLRTEEHVKQGGASAFILSICALLLTAALSTSVWLVDQGLL